VVGLVLVIVAWLVLWHVDAGRWSPRFWEFRDDGIITLSHARGLLDTGSVSVSASGARVDGFSAPLQFALFVAAAPLLGHNYEGFMRLQTLLGTALLGGSVFWLLWSTAPQRRRLNVVLSLVAPLIVLSSYHFFAWQSSGMENVTTNALGVGVIALMVWALTRAAPTVAAAMAVGVTALAFSLTRSEFIVHAAPLVGVYAWLHYRRFHNLRDAMVAPLCLVIGWFAAAMLQYSYFGALRPNSGYVEGIDPIAHLQDGSLPFALIALGIGVGWLFARWAHRAGQPAPRRQVGVGLITVATLVAALAATLGRYGSLSAVPGLSVVTDAYVEFLLIPLLVAAAILYRYTRPRSRPALWLLGTVVVTGTLEPFIFGGVRWDPTRAVSFLLPAAAMALLITLRDSLARLRRSSPNRWRPALLGVGVLAPVLAIGWGVSGSWNQAIDFCCNARPLATSITATADRLAHNEQLPAPIVANPDLGAISFTKRVNVIDLGLIGDPLLAHLTQTWPSRRLARYLTDVAAPDVVEIHGHWSCDYATWINSPQFQAQYQQVRSLGTTSCGTARNPSPQGIWQRNTATPTTTTSREYTFTRQLDHHPDPSVIAAEIDHCVHEPETSLTRCLYVTRAAYRLPPRTSAHP
jgi:hypothetical protein